MTINGRHIGDGEPIYIIAEIGINHNGSVECAKQLIDVAVSAGCDAVKFQKRTPELCVPNNQRSIMRSTPWGEMTYLEYKKRIEFGEREYIEIAKYCLSKKITWFVSCWDVQSVDFMAEFEPPCYKIPSACITNTGLILRLAKEYVPIIVSTGMSTMPQVEVTIDRLCRHQLLLAQCTSTYPAKNNELNLRVIQSLQKYGYPVGYSGHEVGLQTTIAAAALGAAFIERHITLDRSMWGTDQSASVEPQGLHKLVRDIRIVEQALGDGIKRVYDSELPVMSKLRRI